MRPQRYRGLLVVVLWQVVPIGTHTDDVGRTRVGFGFGFGQFENIAIQYGGTDCDGNRIRESETVRRSNVRVAGAEIDTWVRPNVRLTGFGGGIASDSLGWSGAFAGVMAAYEARMWGAGGGGVLVPGSGSRSTPVAVVPAVMVRYGTLDGVHGVIDAAAPSPVFGMSGLMRIGVGYNRGVHRGVGGLAGLSVCHYCMTSDENDGEAAAFLELAVPVTRNFDLDARMLYGPGREYALWGVALGARTYLGRPRPGIRP